MIYRADLHTHSVVSDGQYAPAELAKLVKARGAQVWALTDHDNLGGLDEAITAGESLGLRVISGIELSSEDYPNLHILGYGFSDLMLRDWAESLKKARDERKYRIWDFLRAQGLEISLEEVDAEAVGGSVGRPHFAKVMLRHGYVSTRREAFDRYLDTPEYREYQKSKKSTKPSAQTCVKKIKEAGGKASLAHPYQIVFDEKDEGKDESLDDLVKRLTDCGLDAIECYYPIHTREQTTEYLTLAKKFDLHITGGSDFHGEKNKPDHPLAVWSLELDWLL